MSRAESTTDRKLGDYVDTTQDQVYFPNHVWYDTTPCVTRVDTRPEVEWDTLTPCVRRLSKHERLLGVSTFTEKQEHQQTRVVHEDTAAVIADATRDGHDYSDCGGDV